MACRAGVVGMINFTTNLTSYWVLKYYHSYLQRDPVIFAYLRKLHEDD